MKNKILPLAKKFIAIPSIAGNEEALTSILKVATTYLPGFTVEKFEKNGIKSILIYNTSQRPKKFKIILNGHLDVIPGKDAQYTPKVVGDKLYGVGAMDMKGNVACMLLVFKEVAKKVNYPLALQIVTDEQSGGINGTKYQIEQGALADFIISGETTNFEVVHQAKGAMWLKITFIGKSAHGAYIWQGENALLKAHKFIADLLKVYPIPSEAIWDTTVNVSKLETTNTAFNKIPDEATLWLDIRYVGKSRKAILQNIKKLLPKGSAVQIVFEDLPISIPATNTYIQLLQKSASQVLKKKIVLQSAHGTSDMTHYATVGCPGIEFGAQGLKGNTSQEYISIASLEKYYLVLKKFLLDLDKKGKDV